MTTPSEDLDHPHIQSIFVPTDFSEGAYLAFLHGLKIALATKSKLTLMHVDSYAEETHREDFPHIRETLAKWGEVSEKAKAKDVLGLGINVQKIVSRGQKPIAACCEFLDEEPPDLIVLATHQEGGRHGWFGRDRNEHLAEPLADIASGETLFVPCDTPGFVNPDTGEIQLRNIVVPIADDPRPQRAVDSAARIAHRLGDGDVIVHLLHVGAVTEMPAIDIPENGDAKWDAVATQGKVDECILTKARQCEADLIVMTTDGHHGFLDALRGTTTERVMRGAHCPLLAIPPGA